MRGSAPSIIRGRGKAAIGTTNRKRNFAARICALASISQPVQAEHALAADGEAVFVGLDQLKEVSEVVVFDIGVDELLALLIHEADAHLAGVQIDSAIVFLGGGVIFHRLSCWVSCA